MFFFFCNVSSLEQGSSRDVGRVPYKVGCISLFSGYMAAGRKAHLMNIT